MKTVLYICITAIIISLASCATVPNLPADQTVDDQEVEGQGAAAEEKGLVQAEPLKGLENAAGKARAQLISKDHAPAELSWRLTPRQAEPPFASLASPRLHNPGKNTGSVTEGLPETMEGALRLTGETGTRLSEGAGSESIDTDSADAVAHSEILLPASDLSAISLREPSLPDSVATAYSGAQLAEGESAAPDRVTPLSLQSAPAAERVAGSEETSAAPDAVTPISAAAAVREAAVSDFQASRAVSRTAGSTQPASSAQPERSGEAGQTSSPAVNVSRRSPEPPMGVESSARSARQASPAGRSMADEDHDDAEYRSIELPILQGNSIEIRLEGRGWVFLGSDMDLQFLSKEREENGERFSFYLAAAQNGYIRFQRQDLVSGMLQQRNLDATFVSADSQPGSSEADETPPAANDGTNGAPDSAVLVALSPGKIETAAMAAVDAGELSRAVDLFSEILEKFPAYRYADRVLFSMGTIMETPGVHQDIPSSLGMYRLLVDYHPFSRYESQARERIRYIQRNFIRVF